MSDTDDYCTHLYAQTRFTTMNSRVDALEARLRTLEEARAPAVELATAEAPTGSCGTFTKTACSRIYGHAGPHAVVPPVAPASACDRCGHTGAHSIDCDGTGTGPPAPIVLTPEETALVAYLWRTLPGDRRAQLREMFTRAGISLDGAK